MKSFARIFDRRVVVFDGATGTELQSAGMPAGVCPEQWCLENPEVLSAVHAAYVKAGAAVVYSATFGANRFKLGQYGLTDVQSINRRLAQLAKKAAGKALVAGSIGPTGKFVEPFGDLCFDEAVAVFTEQIKGLKSGGADLVVIETMLDIQEARAALLACREAGNMPAIVTMTFERDGRTLNGTDPVSALITLQSLGARAIGCNCSTGPEQMLSCIEAMKPYATVPLVAKPNAGIPRIKGEKTVFDMQPAEFGRWAAKLVKAGANAVGGCCGTTPLHIKAVAAAVKKIKPIGPRINSLSAVSSARRACIFAEQGRLIVVGECLNPTGKKALQEELRQGKMSLVRSLAKEQERQGADLLDVNAGVPGIDEEKTVRHMLSTLAVATDLPLVIDSSNPKVIETALRLYPGRALINSISAEPQKARRLFKLARHYGAMAILLPLTGKKIPATFNQRRNVIQQLLKAAGQAGLSRADVVVDGLVLAVSSQGQAGKETLATLAWCRNSAGVHTIAGLSNVSFGMPERGLLNAAFLAMARAQGLSLVIANPLKPEIRQQVLATDFLLGHDPDAQTFLRFCQSQTQKAAQELKDLTPLEQVSQAILEGNREDIIGLLEKALAAGLAAESLMQDVLVPAITQVGDLYEKKQYFLPQLIASAEAMKKAVAYLEPRLFNTEAYQGKKIAVILATVQGDIHDIGKNIVGLMLKNHGFDVIDLGKDVSTDTIITTLKKTKAVLVGLSALMTTTMVNMDEVIKKAKQAGIDCRFVLGGAVVTEDYARKLGAGYARDGVAAVRMFKQLSGEST